MESVVYDFGSIDKDLVDAVDLYLANLKHRMLKRLLKGEAEHHGKWREYTIQELDSEADDEISDYHVYQAMIEWKERSIERI